MTKIMEIAENWLSTIGIYDKPVIMEEDIELFAEEIIRKTLELALKSYYNDNSTFPRIHPNEVLYYFGIKYEK